jgi:hypothetical protein
LSAPPLPTAAPSLAGIESRQPAKHNPPTPKAAQIVTRIRIIPFSLDQAYYPLPRVFFLLPRTAPSCCGPR